MIFVSFFENFVDFSQFFKKLDEFERKYFLKKIFLTKWREFATKKIIVHPSLNISNYFAVKTYKHHL